jgi:hypothetical protein
MMIDNKEFEPIRGDPAYTEIGLTVNEGGRDEHSPQLDRYIRTIN